MRIREWIATFLCLFVISLFVNVAVMSIFRVIRHEQRIKALEEKK
jgi:hypothetical protein